MITIKDAQLLQICFDGIGREIEILDATQIKDNIYRIDENPVFTELVSFGDIIKVKQDKEIFHYVETVYKSNYIRHSWLLSEKVSRSNELEQFKIQIAGLHGKWEQIFGGIFVVNIPNGINFDVKRELQNIINKAER